MNTVVNNRGIIGTTADMAARIRAVLPAGWFPVSPPAPASSATPVLDGLLSALGAAWSFCFGLLCTTADQARLATATDAFLDMASQDFFGSFLPRQTGEADASFRARISAQLISQRGTRADASRAVEAVTTVVPFICEPQRALDCGAYSSAMGARVAGGFGYGVFGTRYGSTEMRFQYLLNVTTFAAFAPGMICTRQSAATFVDASGLICVAAPYVMRPLFQNGSCLGPLIEPRGFNLVRDSRFWNGFAQPAIGEQAAASWTTGSSASAVFAGDPVMTVFGIVGTRIAGPSVDVATAGAAVVASVWIMIPADSALNRLELALTDLNVPGNPTYVSANMSIRGEWQRLSAAIIPEAASGQNLRAGILLSSATDANATVLTQCWQIETGTVPTSYIPTNGVLGIRAQDDVVNVPQNAEFSVFSVLDVQNAIAFAIPAATVAWTSVAPAYVV